MNQHQIDTIHDLYLEEHPIETGICLDCGKDCLVIYEDEGYGATEFWGFTNSHSIICASSQCCGAEID